MAVEKGQKGKLKCFIELLFFNSATLVSIICRASFIAVLHKTYSCIEIRIDEVTLHVYDFFQYYSATNKPISNFAPCYVNKNKSIILRSTPSEGLFPRKSHGKQLNRGIKG